MWDTIVTLQNIAKKDYCLHILALKIHLYNAFLSFSLSVLEDQQANCKSVLPSVNVMEFFIVNMILALF